MTFEIITSSYVNSFQNRWSRPCSKLIVMSCFIVRFLPFMCRWVTNNLRKSTLWPETWIRLQWNKYSSHTLFLLSQPLWMVICAYTFLQPSLLHFLEPNLNIPSTWPQQHHNNTFPHTLSNHLLESYHDPKELSKLRNSVSGRKITTRFFSSFLFWTIISNVNKRFHSIYPRFVNKFLLSCRFHSEIDYLLFVTVISSNGISRDKAA